KLLAVVFDEAYTPLGRAKEKVGKSRDNEAVLEKMVEVIKDALDDAGAKPKEISAIGVACPGPVDFENGIVLETPNLGLENFPIRDRLSAELEVPVFLENDVNAGTYGEYVSGAGRGFSHIVGLFPGTGLGGGLIFDGRLFRGATGGAGEIGHMIIQVDGRRCGCGQYGCLEAMASKTAIAKDLVALATTGSVPTIYKKAGSDFAAIKSAVIEKGWREQESAVVDLVERAARHLGIGMANCVNIFNPELIIIGGGLVEKLGAPYIEQAESAMRKHAMSRLVSIVSVKQAELGDDSTVIGAAALAREHQT
ncbi:MAG: ROK family protein, partial [Spirochaetes bacterium]|nr:ROK family protein [Spirochaetota bacterium]